MKRFLAIFSFLFLFSGQACAMGRALAIPQEVTDQDAGASRSDGESAECEGDESPYRAQADDSQELSGDEGDEGDLYGQGGYGTPDEQDLCDEQDGREGSEFEGDEQGWSEDNQCDGGDSNSGSASSDGESDSEPVPVRYLGHIVDLETGVAVPAMLAREPQPIGVSEQAAWWRAKNTEFLEEKEDGGHSRVRGQKADRFAQTATSKGKTRRHNIRRGKKVWSNTDNVGRHRMAISKLKQRYGSEFEQANSKGQAEPLQTWHSAPDDKEIADIARTQEGLEKIALLQDVQDHVRDIRRVIAKFDEYLVLALGKPSVKPADIQAAQRFKKSWQEEECMFPPHIKLGELADLLIVQVSKNKKKLQCTLKEIDQILQRLRDYKPRADMQERNLPDV
jgi:hypothetical protein